MSSKESNLKEKFRIALNSTAKVISDDFDLNKKNFEEKKAKDIVSLEIEYFESLVRSKLYSIFDIIKFAHNKKENNSIIVIQESHFLFLFACLKSISY